MAGSLRFTLAAVGRAKAGPQQELFQFYVKRLSWPLELREVEERRPLAAVQRKAKEGQLLLNAVPADAKVVALDESGQNLSSEKFAALLSDWRDQGFGQVAFIIGGADGLAPEVLKSAHVQLSFGRATWPHMLVRGLLAEQLFRAQSILSGHPYHRQ